HGEKPESAPSSASVQSFWNRRRVTALALVTSAVAVTVWWVVPSDTWNPQIRRVSGQIAATLHSWVNPQPVTPAQAPTSHENFRRASDEYKLPVAEAIPDATTDPSQIRVLPVVDPTVKQPNTPAASPLEPLPAEATPAPAVGDQRTASAVADNLAPAVVPTSVVPAQTQPQPAVTSIPFKPDSAPIAPRPSPPHYTAVNVGIPSSLRSQIASMTPEASGNKPPEAAMATFEPVSLPEATMKNLLLQQTTPLYPESAKGQSGTVVLQVLIGRDGTVQDAKFLQGSLLFARSAIDAVRQWRFQPYMMNGRPVSTTSALTVTFKPST
ncbi:MAG TPA: TonB family protein, partial [Candidatus Sulfotelmatobacter sp.]